MTCAIKWLISARIMIQIRKMKNLILAITAITLSGCFQDISANGNPGLFTPRPMFLSGLPRGDDSYSTGFREGCYNFIGQTGYGAMRMFDKPVSQDVDASDRFYWDGYRSGDRYCSVYVNRNIDL